MPFFRKFLGQPRTFEPLTWEGRELLRLRHILLGGLLVICLLVLGTGYTADVRSCHRSAPVRKALAADKVQAVEFARLRFAESKLLRKYGFKELADNSDALARASEDRIAALQVKQLDCTSIPAGQ